MLKEEFIDKLKNMTKKNYVLAEIEMKELKELDPEEWKKLSGEFALSWSDEFLTKVFMDYGKAFYTFDFAKEETAINVFLYYAPDKARYLSNAKLIKWDDECSEYDKWSKIIEKSKLEVTK